MNPIVLLDPLSYLRHDPAKGFANSPDALIYQGATACVRFDKASGTVTLEPPGADVLALLQALQALAVAQEADERAAMLAKLAKRPY
nr:hypothetical protein [uncultured bacterium]